MQLNELGSDWRGFTNISVALSGSVQTITVNAPFRHLVINNIGSSIIYFTLDGTTPTTANFQISGGQSFSIDGLPAIGVGNLKILGSAASGTAAILAW